MIKIQAAQRTEGYGEDGWRALAPLAHPLTLLAAASLLLNALIWQPLFASWWTGKIGDAAWMVIAPLLVAAGLSALRPVRARLSRRALGVLACALTALAFGAAKAIPAVNSAVLLAGAALGYAFKLRLDPTDLLALPFVLVAGWVWQHPPTRPRRSLQAVALGLAALAVLADSAAPTNFGFNCLVKTDSAVYVVGEVETHPSIGQPSLEKTIYRSDDRGVNWTKDAQFDASKANCEQTVWPVSDPSRAAVGLYYVPGKGLYASSDNGQILKLERPLRSIAGLVVDATTGNVIVAAGTDGVWVRTAAGAWTQTLKTP